MEYWLFWVIVVGIGLVTGFIVHSIMRITQGGAMLSTLLMGIIGAVIAAFYLAQRYDLAVGSMLANRFVWAFIGSVVLSVVTELLFAGSRRGRVVST